MNESAGTGRVITVLSSTLPLRRLGCHQRAQ